VVVLTGHVDAPGLDVLAEQQQPNLTASGRGTACGCAAGTRGARAAGGTGRTRARVAAGFSGCACRPARTGRAGAARRQVRIGRGDAAAARVGAGPALGSLVEGDRDQASGLVSDRSLDLGHDLAQEAFGGRKAGWRTGRAWFLRTIVTAIGD